MCHLFQLVSEWRDLNTYSVQPLGVAVKGVWQDTINALLVIETSYLFAGAKWRPSVGLEVLVGGIRLFQLKHEQPLQQIETASTQWGVAAATESSLLEK